jgi:hypothetical protein
MRQTLFIFAVYAISPFAIFAFALMLSLPFAIFADYAAFSFISLLLITFSIISPVSFSFDDYRRLFFIFRFSFSLLLIFACRFRRY